MILVYNFLWKRLNDYAAKYQSGLNVVATFNNALAEVQLEVFSDLSPYYQTNEKVRLLLAPWVKSAFYSSVNGSFTVLSNQGKFERVISMGVHDTTDTTKILYEINPITEGELVMVNRLPQRRPSIAKRKVYYIMDTSNVIRTRPTASSLPVFLYYLVYPSEAKIAFTYSVSQNEDIMTYDAGNSIDLLWSEDAANIILYKMLEKFGISDREPWLAEYAKLGVSKPVLQ